MNKQQLASKIWQSADVLRSNIDASEYKDYILGFMFYKFLSEKEENYLHDNHFTIEDIYNLSEKDEETVNFCKKNIGFFIESKNLFSYWINLKNDFKIENVTVALSAFSRLIDDAYKGVYSNIFDTLDKGMSSQSLGTTTGEKDSAIRSLIHIIDDIPMDGDQDYDLIGFIYEYLIGNFAANAGKKAGEFYTPHEAAIVMSKIIANNLKDRKEIQIYDSCSGSGSLLINIGQAVAENLNDKNSIKYYAQELITSTYNLTRMNLIMRGISPSNIEVRNGDTLKTDWPININNISEPLLVDAVVSNPPYSHKWDSKQYGDGPRFVDYGVAPDSKADYAFLLHDLYHLKPNGTMTIVLPHGVLFRGGQEEVIRKKLIEKNKIDAIIGMPANTFYGTGIPTIIMVLKQNRPETDVLIIDASRGFEKVGDKNKLRARDIKKIVDTYIGRLDIHKYSRKVGLDEITNNNYNLNIPRYVDSSDEPEKWDIKAIVKGGLPKNELDDFAIYWEKFPKLKEKLYSKISENYYIPNKVDFNLVINSDDDVKNFEKVFKNNFSDLHDYLHSNLISQVMFVDINSEENEISNFVMGKFKGLELFDKYDAYSCIDNQWKIISNDIDTFQSENYDAGRKIDDIYETVTKNGKKIEKIVGQEGRIIPFSLIQDTYFSNDLNELKEIQNKLDNINFSLDEILDSLSEEEKDSDIINDKSGEFVNPVISKKAKEIIKSGQKYEDDSLEYKIIKVSDLNDEFKKLSKDLKTKNATLVADTKKKILHLSDKEIVDLLDTKWIKPLQDNIMKISSNVISSFVSSLTRLNNKYETSLIDNERQILNTENALLSQLKDLCGSSDDMEGISGLEDILKGNNHE